MQTSAEGHLRLLQRFVDQPAQVKQIHSRLVITGHLLLNSAAAPPPSPATSTWLPTLLYNALVRSYSRSGQPHEALVLFTHMLAHRAPPNSLTFPPLVKSSVLLPSWGRPLHAQAIRRGVSWDPFIKTSFINFYARIGRLADALQVFDEIPNPCLVAWNAKLDALCRNEAMGSALSVFNSMPELDVVSWTSLISGLSSNGNFHEAIDIFRKMNLRPNEATYVSVLSSCAHLQGGGGLRKGKQIHGHLIRCESELSVFVGTAIVDLYGKTGCLRNAEKVFDRMGVRKVFTWNAMISSLACNGEERQGLGMFGEMLSNGLKPNALTFISVLTACARGQFVESGLELYRSMTKDFGLEPLMEHYGCIVDLLGRAGLLSEASEFIESMPFEPDASVLGALLGACKIHGAIDLGNRVGRKLLEIQHGQRCGRTIALWNILAESNEWNSAANLRKAIVESGIEKIPGFSFLDSL
ncbi:putative pentatricopeptide repeat-containing protein At1g10330 [Punica granatum]|uniref:Uncharacterized protein n=2 Tax=Punica granatum TaxID=22663 RepID=A0A218WRA5_PUNGR|nr:putative pentatricopeptide repeat-containing protein At1g10330 [Punica granatum]OWM75384.1 hypothetical protein CDL15_Pgr021548 [Punica granatum]PKI41902.1 hypothetical protein CRG98_037708 [Punica granatum]